MCALFPSRLTCHQLTTPQVFGFAGFFFIHRGSLCARKISKKSVREMPEVARLTRKLLDDPNY